MAQPTLTYGTATITLPYPSGSERLVRGYEQTSGARRTVGGYLRRWVAATWYTYRLDFEHQDRSVFDQVTSLVAQADAAGTFPSFTWSGGQWLSTGTAVPVLVELSELQPSGPLYDYGNFGLTLTEVNPR